MRVLIACEESQRVTLEMRRLGHEAYSCDMLPCSGGHPEWHFHQDALLTVTRGGGRLETGEDRYMSHGFDLMVSHPPCTYLTSSGARWFSHPDDGHLPVGQRRPHPLYPTRAQDREDAIQFFLAFANASVPKIAIENPIGILSTRYRKPDQIVHPWWFGDQASKSTCLWLKDLPLLTPTNIVSKGEFVEMSSGRRMAKWFADTKKSKVSETRYLRSKTFPGFARAMAEQWAGPA